MEQSTTVHALQVDYLIVGTGAMGMAFADEMVTHDRAARVLLVDRRDRPGGHWNDAYPFVGLHQPAAFYGVNSETLGAGGSDLASRAQILAYFERVMKKLVATGRVTHLPMCDYRGEGRLVSTVAPDVEYQVTVRRKTVEAAYMKVQVPATTPVPFPVDPAVAVVPINGLATIGKRWLRFVVIGAGKTGMDAALFLLARGVDPDRLSWIVPNA
jgi:hypothetical protein